MKKTGILCGALVVVAASGCHRDRHDRDTASGSYTGVPDVTGTYVTEASGTTLGKHWCYSGALVLDSTRHFGSVISLCSDNGPPERKTINGSYHLRTVTDRRRGRPRRVRSLSVVLDQEGGDSKTHTLRFSGDTLRFAEPWWFSAGLRALHIPDPILVKVSPSVSGDSTTIPASSSTPASSRKSASAPSSAKKTAGKTTPAK